MKMTGKTWVILLVGAGALISAFWLLQSPPLPKTEPLPKPNGYDDFLAGVKMLSGDCPDLKTATIDALAGYVASNRAALDRARLGLSRPCRVPTERSTAYMGRHLAELAALKQMARALAAEGRLASLANQPAAAATNYLTVIKFGLEVERGGVLIDALVAIACESMGARQLAAEVPRLSAEQSRALLRQVEDLESGREPIEKIMEQENAWARSQQKGITGLIERGVARWTMSSSRQKVLTKYNQECRRPLDLEASLAGRAFELEKGRPAKDWGDLVPAYLERIPLDPGTTNQLQFVGH